MKVPSREKNILIIGMIISLIGFGVHFASPGTMRSEIGTLVSPYGTGTIPVQVRSHGGTSSFRLDVLGPELVRDPYCKIYILNYSEYVKFAYDGEQLEDLNYFSVISNQSRVTLIDQVSYVDLYIVILNYENETYMWDVYYSAIPDTFYPSLFVGFSGVFVILAGLLLFFAGWKRYFVLGVAINVAFFVIRTTTLVSYSLGLPDIFLTTYHVELYNDYQYFYLSWVHDLWLGEYPYGGLYYYIYGPLWIYLVGIFGTSPGWLPGVPLFFFNVTTGIVVQKIVQTISHDEKKSIFAMMLYLLNPITVMYGSFMWLNPTIYTFFCSLSLLFVLEDRDNYAIVTLGIATLVKQFAVIFFPLLTFYLIKKYQSSSKEGVIKFLQYTALFVGTVIVGSIPFLLYDAEGYVFWMILANTSVGERLFYVIPNLWMPVHFNTFFLWLTGASPFTDVVGWLLLWYVPLIICAVLVYMGYIFFKPRLADSDNYKERSKCLFTQLLVLSFLAVMCVQVFYPRGSYKFYLLTLMPFAALLYDINDFHYQNDDEFKFRPHYLFMMFMSFAVFFWYRFVYFWLLALWALFYVYQNWHMLRTPGYFRNAPPPDDYASLVEESLIEEIEEGSSD